MKRILSLLGIMLLLPSVVLGGFASNRLVEIFWDEQEARGNLSATRFSDNPVEQIGCAVSYYEQGGGEIYSYAVCKAVLGEEEQIICYTENVELVDKIAGLNHYSWLTFSWEWDEALEYNKCTVFRFSTYSHHIPEFVLKKAGKNK